MTLKIPMLGVMIESREYNLTETVNILQGPSPEQIIVFNQWAATALDKYHQGSKVEMEFIIDKNSIRFILNWDSNFSKDAMKEKKKIAEEGGVSLAMFIMSVLLDYKYLQQSEIGEGVDYRFQREYPDLNNFLQNSHFIEISGILEETADNTLQNRIRGKHIQIERGTRRNESSSVIVTLFKTPISVKEIHK